MPHQLSKLDRVQRARDLLDATEAHFQESCAQLSMREYIEARQKWNEAAAEYLAAVRAAYGRLPASA
jgi:hypothetical protein